MENWINENLSKILDFPVPKEMAEFLMKIENERDLDDYLQSFLDYTNGKHRQFISDFKKRQASSKDQAKYKKENDMNNGKKKQNEKKKGKVKGKETKENKQVQETIKVDKVERKKTKFVNIYSQDGNEREILLKGRYKCNCEAKRHALISNCLNCGRIVCAQEGAGPCFFCEELVCSEKELTILSSNTKQADQLYNKLMNQKANKNLEESIKQRDRLLEYDRDGIQCTKVIDDECDYYQSNNTWLTEKQREKLQKLEEEMHERKHMSHLKRKIYATIDFTGREIIEEKQTEDFEEFNEEHLQDISESFSGIENSNSCPNIEFTRPKYVKSHELELRTSKMNISSNIRNIIQDKEYLEMSDLGLCLSMHQPYASLLVAGIKVHEGRTWYSSHRGRLWIAAASKIPTKEEISTVEQYYRVLKNEKIMFPEVYSTGCLLGCVTVTDVLPQEEYRKSYPDGESDSPYVFICENFVALPIKFPIQGKHKIYKLDQKIHHAALKMLDKCTKNIS
ncbi:activating signal cointegrator 1 [Bombus impatiens]|uniref:Activating signal cointegrator 1 n=1 Tax=Bombus impatiens TaxID=132113 RepID=A0A6P3UZF4_BOMIM|nr:activating signal cointegrator 1 [Bombus impatiens]